MEEVTGDTVISERWEFHANSSPKWTKTLYYETIAALANPENPTTCVHDYSMDEWEGGDEIEDRVEKCQRCPHSEHFGCKYS